MRITIETTNPDLVSKVMSILADDVDGKRRMIRACVANSTKSAPVWVMGEPDSAHTPPSTPNGKSHRNRRYCKNCRKGFLASASGRPACPRCARRSFLYRNVYKPRKAKLAKKVKEPQS